MIATRQEVMRVPDLKKSYSRIPDILSMPHLIDVQTISFRWFEDEGLRELFEEFSPIQDFTSSRMELRFGDYRFGAPKYSMDECRERDLSYSAPLKVNVQLVIKETGEVKEQELFFGDFPLMTPNGTFVINGAERVVVAQLMRSPGAYFTLERDPTSGRQLCYAKLIPNRGAWLEFETTNKDVLYVKVDRRRKLPATILLRAADQEPGLSERELGTNERLSRFFTEIDGNPEHHYIQATTEREPCQNREDAVLEFYRRMRPGDPPTRDSASALLNTTFFNPRRYDMGQVGRYKVNKRLRLQIPPEIRTLTFQDVVAFIGEMIRLNNAQGHTDDIDHLGNRRVRAVGELIQNAFRVGLLRMERAVRERMSITDPDQATPSNLVNIRPVAAAIREFFGASQLSQFMDQTNPLAELTHKRRVSALGPGGLSRERAGFEVRDVHHSHYGRICPIETPEGPNIGLIGSLATYGRVNRYGFIETPYRQVIHDLENTSPLLAGHILRQDIQEGGTVVAKAGDVITAELAHWLASRPPQRVPIQPVASTEIAYLPADEEESYVIAQANTPLDADGRFLTDKVECRVGSLFRIESPENIGLMDVSPKQVFSVAASLIPFLEHDDANRALMGSNMQRQAVPLLRPEAPLVCTGLEEQVARDSGQVLLAGGDGTVTSVSGNAIRVRYDDGQEVAHRLIKFMRSNQGTCINQRPIVDKGQRIRHSQALADSSSTDRGQLALGQALLCAFMSWEGYNFEDAIIVTDALAREDKFTSVHIEKYEVEARDTKLGPEEITRDIPNVGEEALRNLDEEGIIRMGAEVQAGDILVGKITPKGETELTAEEKLLRAIFGEKARDVKDTSLRVPHGEKGKVIDVKVFRREDYPEMPSGVLAMVRVQVAQRRKLSVGDKMAARHGNKGVISKMLPLEDMPYLTDGMPIEVILNPIGVPSRMNLGQVLETHLGWAAHHLGFQAVSPVFDGGNDKTIKDDLGRAWIAFRAGALLPKPDPGQGNGYGEKLAWEVVKAWLSQRGYDAEKAFDHNEIGYATRACLELWLQEEMGQADARGLPLTELEARADRLFREEGAAPPILGKLTLHDGRTGEPFRQPVTVGYIYLMKLVHLVEDKIHARSTGPYSLITQQPLGGKAQFGGQRFGEMEVWALEAYGAAHILQEILTVKSDDVVGRVKTYEAIVKGEDIHEMGVPESFKVLVKELQSLALVVEVLNEDEARVSLPEEAEEIPHLGVNLSGFEKGEEPFGG